jgi:hypothetical protein
MFGPQNDTRAASGTDVLEVGKSDKAAEHTGISCEVELLCARQLKQVELEGIENRGSNSWHNLAKHLLVKISKLLLMKFRYLDSAPF